jgi:protein transport protein SEC61 subunit gamma-like protein
VISLLFTVDRDFFIEFARIARATGVGFLIMGFVGFFVKIVHIPINNILVGGM